MSKVLVERARGCYSVTSDKTRSEFPTINLAVSWALQIAEVGDIVEFNTPELGSSFLRTKKNRDAPRSGVDWVSAQNGCAKPPKASVSAALQCLETEASLVLNSINVSENEITCTIEAIKAMKEQQAKRVDKLDSLKRAISILKGEQ